MQAIFLSSRGSCTVGSSTKTELPQHVSDVRRRHARQGQRTQAPYQHVAISWQQHTQHFAAHDVATCGRGDKSSLRLADTALRFAALAVKVIVQRLAGPSRLVTTKQGVQPCSAYSGSLITRRSCGRLEMGTRTRASATQPNLALWRRRSTPNSSTEPGSKGFPFFTPQPGPRWKNAAPSGRQRATLPI